MTPGNKSMLDLYIHLFVHWCTRRCILKKFERICAVRVDPVLYQKTRKVLATNKLTFSHAVRIIMGKIAEKDKEMLCLLKKN
jgi:hypothetical protein